MSHIDKHLPALAAGTLSSGRFRLLQQHARDCAPCGERFDAALRLLRQLENQTPFQPARIELASVTFPHIKPVRHRRWWIAAALAAAAGAALFVQTNGEWQARGHGQGATATLRAFCGGAGKALHEVDENGCEVGEALAFAAGASARESTLKLQVSGAASAGATVPVTGTPGAEQALDITVPLQQAGTVNIIGLIADQTLTLRLEVRP